MANTHTLIIKLTEGAGLGEKPKVFLDNKQIGSVSVFKELSLTVSAGHHTLLLKGMAGGGRISDINIEESEIVKKCIFGINIMSLSERYFLENTYSEKIDPATENAAPISNQSSVSETAITQSQKPVYAEGNAAVAVKTERKSTGKFFVMFFAAILVFAVIMIISNTNAANKINGTYCNNLYISTYLIFNNDGTVKQATNSSDGNGLVVYGKGTYELDGHRVTVHMNDLRSYTATDVYTYDKSTDTIISSDGQEYKKVNT